MVKIAIGQFMQESHSFTRGLCSWDQFKVGHIYRDSEISTRMQGVKVELAGGIDIAKQHDVDIKSLLACNAVSSGYVKRDVFDNSLDEMLERLQAEMPVDGVFLALHSAMVVEDDEDGSGTVLSAVREIIDDIPIVATLDFHANVTQKMVDFSDALVGYHASPHVDLYETGAHCMQILIDLIDDKAKAATVRCQLPMILSAEKSTTLDDPFQEVMEYAISFEQQSDVLSVSVFYVQPWLDLSDVGCSVIVVTNDNQVLAEEIAENIADELWRRRT
jgi:microcystin degradation protein MlrC